MNMIDRYIAEVGKYLPRKNRQDIQRELRSTLEDMLTDRSQASDQPLDESMAFALLKEYGSPRQVAAGYSPPRYLIGPGLYPFFLQVTQIVLAVLFCVMLALSVIGLFHSGISGQALLFAAGKFVADFLNSAIIALGYIVLAFFLIERSASSRSIAAELREDQGAWDPMELVKEPDPDAVSPAGSIFSIIFILIGLAILNFFPQLLGFWFMVDGEWIRVPVLSPAFFSYLPWINLLGLLEIGLHLLLLRRGAWTTGARLADLALNLAGILLAAAMLFGPALVELNPAVFAGTPLADIIPTLSWVFGWLPALVLGILIIVQGVEVVQAIIHLIRGKTAAV